MSFESPEINGARQEIGGFKSPEINGARQEIGGLEKCINGAWENIWGNVGLLYALRKQCEVGSLTSPSKWGGETVIIVSDDYDSRFQYVVDGSFTNPTISFDVVGEISEDAYYSMVGRIGAYGETEGGSVTTSPGEYGSFNLPTGNHSFEFQLTGDFAKVGFYYNTTSHEEGYDITCRISNILINGQKYITDSTYDFD